LRASFSAPFLFADLSYVQRASGLLLPFFTHLPRGRRSSTSHIHDRLEKATIHLTADGKDRENTEHVPEVHADGCPAASSTVGSIEITSELDFSTR
jgi:hypothetical protein